MKYALWIAFLGALPACAAQQYQATGLVLKIDIPHHTMLVSGDRIPGYMDAMVMPYDVRDSKQLKHLEPGMKIEFRLVVDQDSAYASDIHVRAFESGERDPVSARSLKLLQSAMGQDAPPLVVGQAVPDFQLIDQDNRRVALSEFKGKVIATTFIYTRCPLPNYCFRLTNNFGQLQKRFANEMGRDLILLSISFDPQHDRPEVLAKYAVIWKADLQGWHFLTGSLEDVKRVCGMFGMNFWPDEGILTHSLHTVVLDREGKLVANIEGNQFTAQQLGDLVATTLGQTQ